jgi:hypothetical protein
MKQIKIILTISLALIHFISHAQKNIPSDFVKARITLLDGQTLTGFAKEKMKKFATIVFIKDSINEKTTYDGNQIKSIQIASDSFICMSGDFFKIITSGKIYFIQKQSNTSDIVRYNCSDAFFSTGTDGKIGSYFALVENKLTLINKKTLANFIQTNLIKNQEAVAKAKLINDDISKLKEAIAIYNTNN